MCGINGISRKDEKLVELMNEATKHRGPDGTKIYSGKSFTFGHNRLAVIDVSENSDQPMRSSDGRYTIVFNGEIYNFKELKKELVSSYNFKTEGDTEVLLAAYARWGESMLSRLRGIFAFAIHNEQDGSILLVRDHMGVKPLYYSLKDGAICFSSEIAGLVATGLNILDRSSLSVYLSLQYVPSPQTLVQNVKKLQPGELLRFKNGQVELKNYANDQHRAQTNIASENTYEVIAGAIRRQLVSDREVGIFLSGGLDSSIVLHHCVESLPSIKTFSMGFELDDKSPENIEKFNYDMKAAKKTASHYGSDHYEFIVTHDDVVSNLESALIALDEPVANATSLSKYLLSRFAREKGVVVVLGGDGGDEMFVGYPRYKMALIAEDYQKLPAFFENWCELLHPKFKKLNTPLGSEFHQMIVSNPESKFKKVLRFTDDTQSLVKELFQSKYQNFSQDKTGATAFVEIDRLTWLPDESLHSTDRASMMHGVEYRVPLLDLEVLDYTNRYSIKQHSSYWVGKKMLNEAYKNILPKHLFGVPKKGWFSPGAKWLRNESINKLVFEIISDQYYDGFSDLIDWSQVQEMLQQHTNKNSYNLYPIWNLIQLQVWGRGLGVKFKYD